MKQYVFIVHEVVTDQLLIVSYGHIMAHTQGGEQLHDLSEATPLTNQLRNKGDTPSCFFLLY